MLLLFIYACLYLCINILFSFFSFFLFFLSFYFSFFLSFLSLYSRKVKWMVFALLEFSASSNSWAHVQASSVTVVWWWCCSQFPGASQKSSATKELGHRVTSSTPTAVLLLPYRWTHFFHLPCTRKCVHVLFCHLWPIYPAFCFIITSLSVAGTHLRGARNQRHDANWSTPILMLNARL